MHVTKFLQIIFIRPMLFTAKTSIKQRVKGDTMLNAIKNVVVTYFISLSEVHPEVTRF
jgi:hypothetical protein